MCIDSSGAIRDLYSLSFTPELSSDLISVSFHLPSPVSTTSSTISIKKSTENEAKKSDDILTKETRAGKKKL